MTMQSHPELSLEQMKQKILPALTEKKLLSEEDVVETLKVFETKLPVSCVVWSPSRRFIAVGCTSHPASKPLAPVVVPEVDTNGDIIQDPNVRIRTTVEHTVSKSPV